MRSPTKSPYWGQDSRLRQVWQDAGHYRSGRWVLLAQGVALGALGLGGLLSTGGLGDGADGWGAPVLMLRLTPVHSAVLLVYGLACVAATPRRRTTVWAVALGFVGGLLLFTIGVVVAARGTPGVWGLDFADSWLHAVLMVLDLALLVWLLPDELQDPVWVRKRSS